MEIPQCGMYASCKQRCSISATHYLYIMQEKMHTPNNNNLQKMCTKDVSLKRNYPQNNLQNVTWEVWPKKTTSVRTKTTYKM